MHCSSIPGLFALDASSTHPVVTTRNISRYSPKPKDLRDEAGGGGRGVCCKTTLVENQWYRELSLNSLVWYPKSSCYSSLLLFSSFSHPSYSPSMMEFLFFLGHSLLSCLLLLCLLGILFPSISMSNSSAPWRPHNGWDTKDTVE